MSTPEYNVLAARLQRTRWFTTASTGIPSGSIKRQIGDYRRLSEQSIRVAEEELEKARAELSALRREVQELKQLPATPPP